MSDARTPATPLARDIDAGVWTKAWLLLDVSAAGTVTRLKVLDDPGYDLTPTAIRAAFALTFDPARDRAGRPTSAWMLWSFEWPSYDWIREHDLPTTRLTSDVGTVPCRGSGPTRTVYRDCSTPDIAKATTQPWIEPASSKRPR